MASLGDFQPFICDLFQSEKVSVCFAIDLWDFDGVLVADFLGPVGSK
jgi:hypothetical protein